MSEQQRCQCGAVRGKGDFCQYCGADIRTNFERKIDKVVEVSKPALQQVKSVAKVGLIIWIIVSIVSLVIFGFVIFFIVGGISNMPGLSIRVIQGFQMLLQTT